MQFSTAPLRISFFGGSTDYKDFYEKHGSVIVGTTIDKYAYSFLRYKPPFLKKNSYIAYSNHEIVNEVEEIANPLIKETLKYFSIYEYIDLITFNDVPSRTGLGGSSSFCVSLIQSIYKLLNKPIDNKKIINQAIDIERNVLKDSGGIQDQIWAGSKGFNTITIDQSGNFRVRPLSISQEFIKEFRESIALIYTNSQRENKRIAESHEKVDKKNIYDLAIQGQHLFEKEDIKSIGKLLRQTWEEKKRISDLITTKEIDSVIDTSLTAGAYGAKLLGSGGCGFVCIVGDPKTISKIKYTYKDRVFDFNFET
tara:strand:+ start:14710 stop:15639 length:930 start_codon:yes stop_codon:yes gene_type:complete